jgi:glycosyltransferase involved in cell wall biosynthesis
MRHAWHGNEAIRRISAKSVLAAWIARRMLHNFRLWISWQPSAPTRFWPPLSGRCPGARRYYRRPAQVLYPPVEVERFRPGDNGSSRRDYYLVVSRLRPHKQVSLIIEAFNRLGSSLLVVGEGAKNASCVGLPGRTSISWVGRPTIGCAIFSVARRL